MDKNDRGADYGTGDSMANGPYLPIGWRLLEARQLLRSTFWEMT